MELLGVLVAMVVLAVAAVVNGVDSRFSDRDEPRRSI